MSAAAVLLLTAFTVLSHVVVHVQAYGTPWRGLAARGTAERLARVGVVLLLGGILLWGWDLGWSGWVLGGLGLAAATALALEGVATAR